MHTFFTGEMIRIYFYKDDENFRRDFVSSSQRLFYEESHDESVLAPAKKDSRGKPFIPGSDYGISISHSDGIWVCAIGRGSIGIDIESPERKISPRVAERFFSTEEQEYIRKSEDGKLAFLQVWTRKEAYVKSLGEGIGKNFSKFFTADSAGLVDSNYGMRFIQYDGLIIFDKTIECALCCREDEDVCHRIIK